MKLARCYNQYAILILLLSRNKTGGCILDSRYSVLAYVQRENDFAMISTALANDYKMGH